MSTTTPRPHVEAVRASSFPYDYWHDRYQEYYVDGLRRYLESRGGHLEAGSTAGARAWLRRLRTARYSHRVGRLAGPGAPVVHRTIDAVAWALGARQPLRSPLVGHYDFELGGGRIVRACIDSQDSGDLADPAALDRCDVYFKTNYWADRRYPDKVVPLFNGNPLILPSLDELRALRSQPAEYDLCMVVRVWGGKDEEEGVEHCIRLLEAAARIPCRKFLLAYLVAGDRDALALRLRRSAIPSTTAPLPLKRLWEVTSRSRLNVVRLGMHHCIPWRMCDSLAMGSCTVLDQPPKTIWPVPLNEAEHFWAAAAVTTPDRPTADPDAYRAFAELVEGCLREPERIDQMRRSAADYFDRHLDPGRVGQLICETISGLAV